MGFRPPTTSKLHYMRTTIVSIGSAIDNFLFLPERVIKKSHIFLSFVLGISHLCLLAKISIHLLEYLY